MSQHFLKYFAVVSASLGLVLAGCGGDDDGVGIDTERREFQEVNDSGYQGEVVMLSARDNETQLSVALGQDGSPGGNFEAVIQNGSCDGLSGEVLHELGALESGVLMASVPVVVDDLTGNDRALVVFESQQRSVYVAFADLS